MRMLQVILKHLAEETHQTKQCSESQDVSHFVLGYMLGYAKLCSGMLFYAGYGRICWDML